MEKKLFALFVSICIIITASICMNANAAEQPAPLQHKVEVCKISGTNQLGSKITCSEGGSYCVPKTCG